MVTINKIHIETIVPFLRLYFKQNSNKLLNRKGIKWKEIETLLYLLFLVIFQFNADYKLLITIYIIIVKQSHN